MKWLLCVLMLWPAATSALDVSSLGGLPVQHEGRVKPLESVARIYWQRFSGSEKEATQKLVQTLFAPADMLENPLFLIRSNALRSLLKLPEREDDLYAYSEVTPALKQHRDALERLADKDANQLTANEQALWSLYMNINDMTQLSASLSLFLPIMEDGESYYLMLDRRADLRLQVQQLVQQKGSAIDDYTAEEQQLALRAMRLDALESGAMNNHLLRLIPTGLSEEWLAAWAVLNEGKLTPYSNAFLQHWQALTLAYAAQDQVQWDDAITALKDAMTAHYDDTSLQLEQLYYQFDFVNLVLLCYALTLLAAWLISPRLGLGMMGFALTQHAILLLLRILILGRPPVTTLYESTLFVSFVVALCGLWLCVKSKQRDGMMIGAGLAAMLLTISGVYAGDGDPMAMPIAVLNTNFWLATHVIIITAGYGATLIAGTLAHLALWRSSTPPYLQTTAILALLLTTVGTILGGVWADQSWGRFWGWDPKENGALLIVLWLAWLLHARMTRYVGVQGFSALLACSNIIVALSWFGVNLLNIGLHSYGFTSEAALGLFAFCALELLGISMLYWRSRRRA